MNHIGAFLASYCTVFGVTFQVWMPTLIGLSLITTAAFSLFGRGLR
jgi:hypothetical protein